MFTRNYPDQSRFNPSTHLPFELRLKDFEMAMQDVYDFFYDVDVGLAEMGLDRLGVMLRPAIMSGIISDMLTSSLARHSRALTVNRCFNGHPDLIVRECTQIMPSRREQRASRSRQPERSGEPSIHMEREISGCASSCTR